MVEFVSNNALGLGEKSGREFCEPDSDANHFRQGFLILTDVGSRGATPVGDVGGETPHQKLFFSISFKS